MSPRPRKSVQKPDDTEKWKHPEDKTLQERCEMLMAHINTLDLLVGSDYRRLVEARSMDKLHEWRTSFHIDLSYAPEHHRFLIVADIYRDFLEAELKSLSSLE